jgi:hypothetical protein
MRTGWVARFPGLRRSSSLKYAAIFVRLMPPITAVADIGPDPPQNATGIGLTECNELGVSALRISFGPRCSAHAGRRIEHALEGSEVWES